MSWFLCWRQVIKIRVSGALCSFQELLCEQQNLWCWKQIQRALNFCCFCRRLVLTVGRLPLKARRGFSWPFSPLRIMVFFSMGFERRGEHTLIVKTDHCSKVKRFQISTSEGYLKDVTLLWESQQQCRTMALSFASPKCKQCIILHTP